MSTIHVLQNHPSTSSNNNIGNHCNTRKYHARITNVCLSGANNDSSLTGIGNVQKAYDDHDKARQNRKERLHYHLNELGIDADLLEDAALRSVTTTGKHGSCVSIEFEIYAWTKVINRHPSKMDLMQGLVRAQLRRIDHMSIPGQAKLNP